jgi:predicted nucleic acid-binding protein
VKLAVRERETQALHAYLEVDPLLVCSAVAIVEVQRGARIADPRAGAQKARSVLERVALLDVDRALLEEAVSFSSAHVRSLDAIHVATAVRAGTTTMLVYDRRLAEAAEAAGIETLAPGA